MPKLKVLSGAEVIKMFLSFGFEISNQKGSHIKLCRNTIYGNQTLTIPNHIEIDKGTLKAILNQASRYISGDELYSHFYHI